MYICFEYDNGSNPYITTEYNTLFKMLKKYDTEQTAANTFRVHGTLQRLSVRKLTAYEKNKAAAREIATQWQNDFSKLVYSWEDCAKWAGFFEWLGKRFGLLEEFKENGII